MPEPITTPIACRPHNHNLCVKTAMTAARATCQKTGARLTPIREQVLLLIWQSHKPLGAYDIIGQLSEQLRKSGERSKLLAPPTVYRALEFLQTQGLVHRIASLNAFIGCSMQGSDHISQFFLCQSCGVAIEIESDSVNRAVQKQAREYGFSIDTESIEVTGLCASCQDN